MAIQNKKKKISFKLNAGSFGITLPRILKGLFLLAVFIMVVLSVGHGMRGLHVRTKVTFWFNLIKVGMVEQDRKNNGVANVVLLPALVPTTTYPLKVSVNGRYLVDQSDQPFFLSGDAAWSLIAQPTKGDATYYYLTDRQIKGFNTLLVSLIEHKFATNAPKNIYGDVPFTGEPFITPNEAYFAHVDYIIAAAAQRGIPLLLAPSVSGYRLRGRRMVW